MAVIREVKMSPCSQYTSDRDPRIIVHITVQTRPDSAIGTTHTFWSKTLADRFITMVGQLDVDQSRLNPAGAVANLFGPDATAERMTSAEVHWLCTPLNETPDEFATRPKGMPV